MSEHRAVVEVFTDGGARGNPGPAAIGAVVRDPSTEPPMPLTTVSRCIGTATSNVAEYEAVIAGLEAALAFPAHTLRLRADSMLVIRQLEGVWKVKTEHLRPLHARARQLLGSWAAVDLAHVRREQNVEADLLVNAALDAG